MGFFIDQERFARYASSKQNSIETESLMKTYFDTLVNLTSIHSRDLPNFSYTSYKDWAFINAFRTTPIETSLNYIEQQPDIKLPVSSQIY